MKTYLKALGPLVLSLFSTGAMLVALNGCGNVSSRSTDASNAANSDLIAAAAQTETATATSTPRPTPVPTPFWKAQATIPNWSHGKKINHVAVRATDKVFALTFDDGPWPHYTRQVLDILALKGVKATFFMVGQEVARRPKLARQVRDEGHAIGNHSWNHPSRPRDSKMQVQRTDQAIEKAAGFRPTLFRPPYGIMASMAKVSQAQGDAVVLWSADSGDWHKPGASAIARHVLAQARPGGIALMHDGGGSRSQSVAALPVIIDALRARGYRFVTVPELLRLRYVAPQATPTPRKMHAIPSAKIKAMQTAIPPSQVDSHR